MTRQTTITPLSTGSKTITFLLSLFFGLILGAVLLGTAVLTRQFTTLDEQLATQLGIGAKTAWYFSRASGTVAYLLLASSTVWGLLLSTRIIRTSIPAPLMIGMHNILSWTAIAFTSIHALALLFDSYYTYTLPTLVIPFIGPYRPEWVGLGIIALYIMIVTSVSFSWRRQLGQTRWRRLHYLTFGAYGLATLHGIMAGTDSGNPGMKFIYWGSALLVLFLTNYRIMAGKTAR
ncbi:MAG: ferric reductase-like transmembrane domain-containing protein [Chloroflexota bacterium]|nr:ferric reductase-like transmembrane domain-containing protein [Anaerolineales bacterium]MCA9977049.1 ferric reductase-like transmembrane domain-containing protein [Anaerolineales bacterium]MCB8968547.1 ferric reductase-like transmembrane domain-containing protein [Ardenticatenaceae bacterium]